MDLIVESNCLSPNDNFYNWVNNDWLENNQISESDQQIDIFSDKINSNIKNIISALDLTGPIFCYI